MERCEASGGQRDRVAVVVLLMPNELYVYSVNVHTGHPVALFAYVRSSLIDKINYIYPGFPRCTVGGAGVGIVSMLARWLNRRRI